MDELENTEGIVKQWLDSADQNHVTMMHMLESKDYSWVLFLGHLVLEKTLKAVYVRKTKKHALFTHDLLRLATKIGLSLSEEQKEWLDEITTFNLNARYDNYKQDFHRLCTREFTTVWVDRIENLRKWLKNQL